MLSNRAFRMVGLAVAALSAAALACTVAEAAERPAGCRVFEKGYGLRSNYYVGGRLTAQVSDFTGLYKLMYFGRGEEVQVKDVLSGDPLNTFSEDFKPVVVIDGKAYLPEFNDTVHYPFGYTSECTLDGVKLRHEFALDNNVVFRRIRVLSNPAKKDVRMRIHQCQWDLLPGNPTREVVGWRPDYEKGQLVAEVRSRSKKNPLQPLRLVIGAAAPVTFPINRPEFQPGQNGRYWLEETHGGDDHLFYFAFNPRPDEDLSAARLERRFDAFRARVAAAASYDSGDREFDAALACAPEVMEAYELEIPGAHRAGPYYFVWTWDSLVHLDALAVVGHGDLVRRTFGFFREQYGEKGLPFAFGRSLVPNPKGRAARGEVQLFFVTLLNSYCQITGDETTKREFLPLARQIIDAQKAQVRPGEVLVRGETFYPDLHRLMLSTTNDFSIVNNLLYYQGLRSWEELTGEDAGLSKALRDEINRKFWEPSVGTYADTVDGTTFARRPVYPSWAVFEVSRFALEVLESRPGADVGAYADWMKRNFRAPGGQGVRTCALDDIHYSMDGGQFAADRAVVTRNYWSVQNAAGRTDALEDFRRMIRACWATYSYPEAECFEFENADLTSNHNDNLGGKQIFNAKALIWDALTLHLGLRVTPAGVAFRPMADGRPFAVRGLTLRGRTLDVSVKGDGTRVTAAALNGKPLADASLVPWTAFADGRNVLELTLSRK